MAWLDGWSYRIPIAIDNTTAAATVNVSAPVPEDFDHFWDTIDTSGDEIRVTGADGFEVLTYAWASSPAFNKTNKVGTLEIGTMNADGTNNTMVLAWLYYGNSGAASGAGSPSTTSQVNGYIYLGKPKRFVVSGEPVTQGLTQPTAPLQKGTAEDVYIWVEMRGALESRVRKSGERYLWEEVHRVEVTAEDDAGNPITSVYVEDKTRFVETERGFYVGVKVDAGSDGTKYTIIPKIWTYAPEITIDAGSLVAGNHRILEPRVFLAVTDVVVPT